MQFGLGLALGAVRNGAAAAPPPPTIADFYGTGLGQVPMDFRMDQPTLTGGLVTAIRNDGGAGSLFNGTPPAGQEPTFQASPPAADFSATGIQQIVMASAANVAGTMVFIPTNLPPNYPISTISCYLVGGARSIGARRPTADTLLLWISTGDTATSVSGVTVPFASGPRIYAVRMAGGTATFYRDGSVLEAIPSPVSPFMVDRFGYSTSHNPGESKNWPSTIGRVVSVIVADQETTYPAIATTWSELATQYGVTIA